MDQTKWVEERRKILEEHQETRATWQRLRDKLNEEEKKCQDKQLYSSYLTLLRSPSGDLVEGYQAMVDMFMHHLTIGTSTDMFDPYELGPGSLAQVLCAAAGVPQACFSNFCEVTPTSSTHRVQRMGQGEEVKMRRLEGELVSLVIVMGTAWRTGRVYVGNGGCPAPTMAYRALLRMDGIWPISRIHLISLLERYIIAGSWLPQWALPHLSRHHRSLPGWMSAEDQEEFCQAVSRLAHLLDTLPSSYSPVEILATLTDLLLHLGDIPGVVKTARQIWIRILNRIQSKELTTTLWGQLMEGIMFNSADEFVDRLLTSYMSGKKSRQLLERVLDCAEVAEGLMNRVPGVAFTLVDKREKRLLRILIRRQKERMVGLKDGEGNNLLGRAAGGRGRTEGVVEMLVEEGWNLDRVNKNGETARDRAVKVGHHGILRVLTPEDQH